MAPPIVHQFSLLHIDVARNSTDDFNPFHDKLKWTAIKNNPYGGPIVLGFQLIALAAHEVSVYRRVNDNLDEGLYRFSEYQLNFASAVKPADQIVVDVKKSKVSGESVDKVLSNRLVVKCNGKLAMAGFKRESKKTLLQIEEAIPKNLSLTSVQDRSFIGSSGLFFKRKFLNTSNGKNFLVGSLIEQSEYFDEIDERVNFPEVFVVSWVSCALLERAVALGHDFLSNPMVYVSLRFSVDRVLVKLLKSNDMLGLFVESVAKESSADDIETFSCYGLLAGGEVVFQCTAKLAPLSIVVKTKGV